MISNNIITYYHKSLNKETRLEEWNKLIIKDVWVFGGQGSSINKGYVDANNVDVRIALPFNYSDFTIGDIIAIGIQEDIQKESDLADIEHYNVTSININNFGHNPHIHLGGK